MTALGVARADGRPWHAIARILSEAVGSHERSQPLRNDFWSKAQDPAELSTVILKRYVKTLRRLERIAEDAGLQPSALLPPSFTAGELAVRLYERDPQAGLEALGRLARPHGMGIEELRRRLEETPPIDDAPVRSAVLAGRAGVVEDVRAAFAAGVAERFAAGAVSGWRPPLRHFRRLGFEVRLEGSGLLAGADLYLSDAAARSDALEDVAQSVLLSFYLPEFWLVVGPGGAGTAEVVRRAGKVLDDLDAPWIGIFALDAAGSVAPVRPPRGAAPIDRTAGYEGLLETFGGRRERRRPSRT